MALLALLLACTPDPTGAFALSFDGAPHCARVDTAGALVPTDYTLDLWIRGSATGERVHPIVAWEGAFVLVEDPTGTLYFHVGDDGGASYSMSVLDGVAHHIAATYAGGEGTAVLFIDGAAVGNAQAFLAEDISDEMQIGCNDDATEGWEGLIDELRVSSVRRYDDDFTVPDAAYDDDDDTLALFHLDEGTGSVFASDGGGWQGTVSGAGWVPFTIPSEQ